MYLELYHLLMKSFFLKAFRVLLAAYLFVSCLQVWGNTLFCRDIMEAISLSRMGVVHRKIFYATKELLKSGTLDYDSYFEIMIREATPETLPYMLRSLIGDYSNTATKPNTWARVNGKIELVAGEVGSQYTRLLMDPGIAFRVNEFVEFARSEKTAQLKMDPLTLRRAFIDSFDTKYYYRATLMSYSGQIVARAFERAAKNPSGLVRNIVSSIETKLQAFENKEDGAYMISDLPVLGNFWETVFGHVMNARSESGVISVSEHPQVAWYAVADNGSKLWLKKKRQFRKGINVYRISMNSFYALPRTIVIDNFQNSEGKYEIGQGDTKLCISIGDPSVELLVPVAIPNSGEVRHYTPRYPLFGLDSPSFEIPKPEDWN
jgi:hypothetical protein